MTACLVAGPCQGVLSATDRHRVLASLRGGATLLVCGTAGDGSAELADDLALEAGVRDVYVLWILEHRDQVPLPNGPCIVLGSGATHLTGCGGASMIRSALRRGLAGTVSEAVAFWQHEIAVVIVMKYDPRRHVVDAELISTLEYFDRCSRQIDWPRDLAL